MKLNMTDWKEFELQNIFIIKYGVNLELNACEEISDETAINFVSRTESNNGISSKVKSIEGVTAQKEGLITVAGGGSVLSTFVQPEPFYSGRDLYTLETKENVSQEVKFFLTTLIKANKFKYNYGRQANKTLPFIEIKLPIQHNADGTPYIDDSYKYSDEGYIPDWQFMEDYIKSLHHKPLTTQNKSKNVSELSVENWKFFYLKNICNITMGNKMDWSAMTIENPKINFVGRSAVDNGVAGKVDLIDEVKPYKAGCITVALGGSLGASYLQNENFYTSQNVSVLEFEDNISNAAKLFISCLIMNESKYKYFPFGRELNTHIRTDFGFTLPIQHNPDGTIFIDETHTYSEKGYVPDWEYMENYMKSLPYGDRLDDIKA